MDWAGSADIVRLLCVNLDPGLYDVTLVTGLTLHPSAQTASFLRSFGSLARLVPQLQRDINPFKDFLAFAALYRIFRRERFDIVHTHTAKAGALGRLAAFLAGVPVIIHTPHGHNFYGYFGPLMSFIAVGIEKFLNGLTTFIIALTDLERDDFIRLGASSRAKMRRIDQGLELERFFGASQYRNAARLALAIASEESAVGLIARLEPVKGPDYFIEAAGLIAGRVPRVKFIVVGEGSMRGRLERRAAELGLAQSCIFTGWRRDIPEILSALDILVLSSLNEAVGIVLLEAQSAGVPLVATRVGGIPEMVQDGQTGLLVAAKDPAAIAGALITLLQDPGLRERLATCARERVRGRFKISDMIDKTSALYREAYRDSPGGKT